MINQLLSSTFLIYLVLRYLQTLKNHVRSRSHPEGSMEQGHLVDEALSICSMYLTDVETKRTRKNRNADGSGRGVIGELPIFGSLGHSTGSGEQIYLDLDVWDQCRRVVLFNCDEVSHFLR